MTKWSKAVGATTNPIELAAKLSGPLSMLTDTDVYNWGADNTRRLQRSLAKASAGTGYSDHLILGEGQSYQKTGHNNRWPNLLRANLAAKGVPVGGTGWVRTSDGFSDLDSRVTTTGAWTFRQAYYETTSSGATMTFTADVAGTAIAVAYFNTSAGFTVAVDGGSPVTVTPAGGATVGTYAVTGLADTTHTVVVTTTTSSPVFIIAFQCYRASGLRIHNGGIFGGESTAFTGTTFASIGQTVASLIPAPDVVHIALGFQDLYSGGKTVAQITANLTTIRNKWPDADAVLYASYEYSGATSWDDYAAALYPLADTLDCPLVNVYQRSGGYTTANTNGLMTIAFYPSTAGHTDWALLAASRIAIESDNTVRSGAPLGTPTSGTLINCTGLPVSGITASTSTALGVGSVNLGHASDTTLTRSAAGKLAVEGVEVLLNGGALGTPASGTLTNCTGLPVSGITASTSVALGVGQVELGHASDTTLTRSAAGRLAVEGVNVALEGGTAISAGAWTPQAYSYKAWTYDPVHIYNGGTVSSGYLYVAAIYIPFATTVTNVLLHIGVIDAALVSGRNFAALYQDGNRLGATADQTTAWGTAGIKTMALSGGAVSVNAGLAYVGWFANNGSATTTLAFGRTLGASGVTAVYNSPLTRYAYANSGLTTATPATLTGFTAVNSAFWAAVS
jgi:hypothetical protein